MKDCIENMRRVNPRLEHQIYRQKPWEWDRYDLATQEVGCQYDVRPDDTVCTCRIRRVRRPEMGYYGLPKQIYAYQEIRNFADIGVGSVKALTRKKVKKIYLPETDDRGVGSSEMCSIIPRRTKYEQENCSYDHKRTSSKCVGDIQHITGCVLSKKLSPIIQTRSGTTSPMQPSCNKNQETGSNTVINNVSTKTVQVNTEVNDRGNAENSIIKDIDKDSTVKGDFKVYQQPNDRRNKYVNKSLDEAAKQTVTEYSSDTLDHNVHNLEYSSEDKLSHVSVDPMENKLEREYRRLFYSRRKDEKFRRGGNPSKDDKPKSGTINSDTKSPSVLKRRFEALRRGLAKKDDSKGSTPLDIKASSQISTASHKDVSVASDPPSLESRSYSNMRTYSPFTSILEHDTICDRRPKYHDSISTKKEKGSWQWSKTDGEDSESTGRKGMFKMWGKKFNLEDSYKHPMPEPPPELAVKKGGKKFFFFKKKSKEKSKTYKAKKSVTTGRCEVKDGIVYKTGRGNQPKMMKEPIPEVLKEYGDIRKKAWLKKYLTRTIESRNSVKIRWYNKKYASSSSTVFELMDHVNNKARMIIKSKSDMSTTESYYQSFTRRQVHYIYQNIEAWMVPKTITDRPNDLPVKINVKPSEDEQDNIETPFSDHKWFIDKSKAFSHKIELVLHSKNFIQKKQSSDYLRINIPKGYFTDLSSYDKRNQSSDEQVYNVVEYETGSEIKKNRIAQSLSTGDHKYNNEEETVDINNRNGMESQVLETVIKSPTTHRDVVIQDSNVYIPKRCDIIGVGIITQRNPREIRKPILKIRDDVSEEESEYAHRTNHRKSKFAESYLRDYYRYWTPLDMDFYSWCVSDSHLGCCSENSKSTFTNQADSSRSCPNILDDFQSATVVSSCDTSSCSHFLANTDEDNAKGSCCFKLFGKKKAEDGITRVLPKDSIEVCKKRKIYAVSNKCKWSGRNDELYSVLSNESRGAQNNLTDYLKVMKPCCVRNEIKKGFCKKHVSLPGCDAMQKSSVEETGDCLPRIVTVKDPAECGACKEPRSPKNAGVDMGRVAEITQAPCNKSYEKNKDPPCTKLPKKRSSLGAQPCDPLCPYSEIPSPQCTPTKKRSPSPKRTCSPPERLSPVAHKLSPIKKPCEPQCPFADRLSPAIKKASPVRKPCLPQCPFAEKLSPALPRRKPCPVEKSCGPQSPAAEKPCPAAIKPGPRSRKQSAPKSRSIEKGTDHINDSAIPLGIKLSKPGKRNPAEWGSPSRSSSPTSEPREPSEPGTPRESSPTSKPREPSEPGTPRKPSPKSKPRKPIKPGTRREPSLTSKPREPSEPGTPREFSPTSKPREPSEPGTPHKPSPKSKPRKPIKPGTRREPSLTSKPREPSEPRTPREPSPKSGPREPSEPGTPRESSPTSEPREPSEPGTPRKPSPKSKPRKPIKLGTRREPSLTSEPREPSEPSPTSGPGQSSELGTPRESSPTSGPREPSEPGTPRESSPTSERRELSEPGIPRKSSPTSGPGESSELGTPREPSPTSESREPSEPGTPREASATSKPRKPSEPRTPRKPSPTSEPREPSEPGTPRKPSPKSKPRKPSEPGTRREPSPTSEPREPSEPSPTSGPGQSSELGTLREPSPTSESREPSEPGTPREASATSKPRKPSEPRTPRKPSPTSESREPSEPGTPREASATSKPRKPSEPRTPRKPSPTSEPREPSEPGTPRKPSPKSKPRKPSEPGTRREPSPTSEPREPSEHSPTSGPGQSNELGTPRESSPTSGPGQSSEHGTPREPSSTSEPREPIEPGTPRESSPTSGPGEPSEPGTPRESSPTSGPGEPSEPGTPRESSPTSEPREPSEPGTPRKPSPTSKPRKPSEPGTPRVPSPTSEPREPSEPRTPRESSPTSEPRESSEPGTPRESSPTSERRELSEPGIPRKSSPTSEPGESSELGTPRELSPTSESREPSEPGTPREVSPTSEPRKPSEPGNRREPNVTSKPRKPSEPGTRREPSLTSEPREPRTPRKPSPTSEPRKPSEPGTRREPSLTSEPREPREPRTPREPSPTSEPREPSEPRTPREPSPTSDPRKPSEPVTRREPSLTSEPSEPGTPRKHSPTSEPREPSEPRTPRKPSPTSEPRKPSERGTRREPSLTSEPRKPSERGTRREPSLTSEPREPSEPVTRREPSLTSEPSEPGTPRKPSPTSEPREPSEPRTPRKPSLTSEPRKPSERGTRREPSLTSESREPSEPGTPREVSPTSEPRKPSEPGNRREPNVTSKPRKPSEPGTRRGPSLTSEPREPRTPRKPSPTSEPRKPSEPGTRREPSLTSEPREPRESRTPREPSPTSEPREPSEPRTPREPSPTSDPRKPSEPVTRREPSLTSEPSEPGTPRKPSPTSEPREPSEPRTPRKPSPTSEPRKPSERGTRREPSLTSEPRKPSERGTRREPSLTSEPREPSEPVTRREPSLTSEPSEPGTPSKPSPTSEPRKPSERGTRREPSLTSEPREPSEPVTRHEPSLTSESREPRIPREPSPTSDPREPSEPGTPRKPSPTSKPRKPSERGTRREPSLTSEPREPSEPVTRRQPSLTSEPSEPGTPRKPSPTSEPIKPSERGTRREPSLTSEPRKPSERGTRREPSLTSEPREPSEPVTRREPSLTSEPSEPGTPRKPSPTSEPIKPSERGTRREPSPTSEPRKPSERGTRREPSLTSEPRKPSERGTRREPSLSSEPREPSEPVTRREPSLTSEPSEPGTPRKPSPTSEPRKPSARGTRREPSLTSEPRKPSKRGTRREPSLTREPREPSEPVTRREPSLTSEPSEPGTPRKPSPTSEPRKPSERGTRREPSLTSEPREPSEPGTPRETRPTDTGQFKSGSNLPISPGKPSPAESGSSPSKSRSSPSKSGSSPSKSRSSPSKSRSSPASKSQYSPERKASPKKESSKRPSISGESSTHNDNSSSHQESPSPSKQANPLANPADPPAAPITPPKRSRQCCSPQCRGVNPEPCNRQPTQGSSRAQGKRYPPPAGETNIITLPAGRNSSKPSGGHENNRNNKKKPSPLKNSVSVQMLLEKSISEPNTNIHYLGEKSPRLVTHPPGKVVSPEHIPLPSKSKSKLSGIWLKMKQFKNFRRDIKENMNIKIQDDDGQLHERRDYTAYSPREQHRPSVVGEMYKASNAIHSVHRISTQVVGDAITSNKIDNKSRGQSDASLTNMIEIQFQMKVTQGDKTTEIGIANDEDEKEGKKSFKQPEEVFVVKNDSVHSIESKDPRNDINIRIVIKNFKPKSAKNKSKAYQDEFCKEITDKFHTVSTGYSDILSDANAKNEFSVHRATVDLTTSSNKFGTEDLQSYDVEACTDTMPIDSLKSVHSANPNESVDDTENNLTNNQDYSDMDVAEEISDKHTKKGDLNVTEDPINICVAQKTTDNYITDNDDTERSDGPSDFTKGNYFIGKYDYTDIDTEKEDLAVNEDLENTDDDAKKLEEKASSHNTPSIKYVEAKEWKSFQQNYEATISTDTDEHDLILEANTSTDNVTAGSVEAIIKPHSREEKKEMLKEVFEKAHATQVKSNIRMRKFRDMLKAVLTSDSSDYDELKINVLAKNLTYASQKSNYLRDSDSMNNYYNSHPISDNDSSTRPVVYTTVENNSECSNSDEFSSEEQLHHEECVCSKLAARLNLCTGTGSGCCYCKSVKTVKKDKEIVCDIKSDDNCDFQTNIVDVQTQNSKCFYKHNTSRHNYTKMRIIETCNMVDKIPGIMHAQKERKALRRSFLPQINHIRKCPMKKFNRNTILTIADDDQINMIRNKATSYDGSDNNDIKKSNIRPSDVLQSNEAKKAVLEIYAEKTVSEDGEHFVAKLPKFVYNRESEIIMNYEAIARNHYTAAMCKRNVIRMSIER